MHEQSETIETPTGWRNVYGKGLKNSGQPLPRLFPWEKDDYQTREEAEEKARRRSQSIDPKTEKPYTQESPFRKLLGPMP